MLVQFQRQSDLAFIVLVKSLVQKNPVTLKELLTCSLATVPHCLGTPDGFFATKANKATMLPFLMKDSVEEVKYPTESMHYFTPLLAWHPSYRCVPHMLNQMAPPLAPPPPPTHQQERASNFLTIHTLRIQSKARREH